MFRVRFSSTIRCLLSALVRMNEETLQVRPNSGRIEVAARLAADDWGFEEKLLDFEKQCRGAARSNSAANWLKIKSQTKKRTVYSNHC